MPERHFEEDPPTLSAGICWRVRWARREGSGQVRYKKTDVGDDSTPAQIFEHRGRKHLRSHQEHIRSAAQRDGLSSP